MTIDEKVMIVPDVDQERYNKLYKDLECIKDYFHPEIYEISKRIAENYIFPKDYNFYKIR